MENVFFASGNTSGGGGKVFEVTGLKVVRFLKMVLQGVSFKFLSVFRGFLGIVRSFLRFSKMVF